MGSADAPNPSLLEELQSQPGLMVVTCRSPTWNEIKTAYIGDNAAQPLAIVRPTNEIQVSDVVKIARRHHVKISVRVGGHDGSGRSIVNECLVVDLREMTAFEVAHDQATARIGGGILTGDVVRRLADHELVTPFPFVPSVGYAGWAMMGGYGWMASNLGLGVDQIKRARVVTAEGDIVEADAELLKGIRGAGGNFGIIVELDIKIYPLEKFLAGFIFFDTEDIGATTEQYFRGYNAMEKSSFAACDIFWFAKPGGLSKWMMAVCFGWSSPDITAGKKYLEQVASLTAGADTSSVQELVSSQVADLVNAFSPPMVYGMQGCDAVNFRHMNETSAKVLGDFLMTPAIDKANLILMHEVRGSSTEKHEDSCFGARLPHCVIQIVGVSSDPKNVKASTEHFQQLYHDLKATGDALDVTYASLAQTANTNMSKQFGDDYKFVMDLKDKYDPEGLFDNTEPRLRP